VNCLPEFSLRHGVRKHIPSSGAIPIENFAAYSVVNGLNQSERILSGSIEFINDAPVKPEYREFLTTQISRMTRQFAELKRDVGRRMGRVERGWGYLVPKIIKEYYENLDYEADETDVQIDQKYKIDIIASKNNEVQAISVKKGQISPQEIVKIAKKSSLYLHNYYPSHQLKRVVVFASKLPEDFLEIRDKLKEKGIDLRYLLPYHVVKRLPKYEQIFYE
jgi:hypothetical protein